MKNVIRNKNFYIMLLLDAVLVTMAYFFAYLLRFEGHIPLDHWAQFKSTLPFLIPLKLICFFIFGLYRGMWRYTSLVDLRNIFNASSLSSIIIVLSILFLYRFHGYSRSVFVIDWVFTLLFIGGIRVAIRVFLGDYFPSLWIFKPSKGPSTRKKKLMIIGAGDAGEKILREIQETPSIKIEPVGLLDDDRSKQGMTIHGVPVLGTVDDINKTRKEFDEILIATPSIRGEKLRRIVSLCEETGKQFRTLPGIWELIEGRVSVKAIRKVHMEDLLDREEIHLDEEDIRQYLKDKRILITGAGGSIGGELVRQVCRFHPRAIAFMEFSEVNLFKIAMECKQRFEFIPTSEFLLDIKNRTSVGRAFREFSPDVVFHAAAYKHVPMQELNPWETTLNNILGTRNLVEAALENQTERFVLVSTDKAVRPTNVMGATKRVAEMLVECVNENTATRLMAVRFGNVLWSSGSAIPIFQKQISKGVPVTVTHPEITRYFMSLSEAAQLILQAGAMGEGNEIFILDMGKSIRIVDLARDLIRLSGFEPDRDIPIKFTGLRPGEKLYEELITEGEGIVATNHEKVLVIRGNTRDRDVLNVKIDELLTVAGTYDATAIKKKLQEIVPEYTPQW
ncbi:MAG: nucleoside-diphosphate sugar epimerase/dehydratase [Thermodesulfobacteriota bacterium]|nr:nucleoside-diphosphate sugar epimerase/dehydratase [Thermodesulfobacteriota bacterium]